MNKFCEANSDDNAYDDMFVGRDLHKNYLNVAVLNGK